MIINNVIIILKINVNVFLYKYIYSINTILNTWI